MLIAGRPRWVQSNVNRGASLEVQWLRIRFPMQGIHVQSPVEELRAHIPQGN